MLWLLSSPSVLRLRVKKGNLIKGTMRIYMGGNGNMGLDVWRIIGVQFECELLGLVHMGDN